MGIKHRIGRWLLPKLPVNQHVFAHARLELNAAHVRLLHKLHPAYRKRIRELRRRRGIKLNLGCGPFGHDGWVNLDMFAHRAVTLRADCRNNLPIGTGACTAIHVEHYFEHLSHDDESLAFLKECRRCLQDAGILRIIVPDAERFARAYVGEGWTGFEALSPPGASPEKAFATKMQALNHVMLQGYEHYGGYDFETLPHALREAGFVNIERCSFGQGRFPGGCIDRDEHAPYSLYVEAAK